MHGKGLLGCLMDVAPFLEQSGRLTGWFAVPGSVLTSWGNVTAECFLGAGVCSWRLCHSHSPCPWPCAGAGSLDPCGVPARCPHSTFSRHLALAAAAARSLVLLFPPHLAGSSGSPGGVLCFHVLLGRALSHSLPPLARAPSQCPVSSTRLRDFPVHTTFPFLSCFFFFFAPGSPGAAPATWRWRQGPLPSPSQSPRGASPGGEALPTSSCSL